MWARGICRFGRPGGSTARGKIPRQRAQDTPGATDNSAGGGAASAQREKGLGILVGVGAPGDPGAQERALHEVRYRSKARRIRSALRIIRPYG